MRLSPHMTGTMTRFVTLTVGDVRLLRVVNYDAAFYYRLILAHTCFLMLFHPPIVRCSLYIDP
jgi:hypothetical protein